MRGEIDACAKGGSISNRKLEIMKKDAKQDIRKRHYLRPTLHAKVIHFGVFGDYGGGCDDDDDDGGWWGGWWGWWR